MDDFHVTFLFVAFVGVTVAVKVKVLPFIRLALVLFNVTLVTGFVTVILQVPVTLLPSTAVAVIIAVPAATAVTTPLFSSTLATFKLDDFQVTLLSVALLGATVGLKATVFPIARLLLEGFMVILFTSTTEGFTVT